MPLPARAVGASPMGLFSTIAKACLSVRARSPAVRGMMRHESTMMPSAARPMTSSGCREFLRVTMLSAARTDASPPRPATHIAGTAGMPRSVSSPMMTQGRNVLAVSSRPAVRGMK